MSINTTIRKILITQTLVTLLAAGGFLLVDFEAAWSAAAGGSIGIVTTACFALWAFSAGVGAPAEIVVKRFYVGEVVKILLTGLLFFVAIVALKVSFLPLLAAYAGTLLAYWLILPFSFNASVRAL